MSYLSKYKYFILSIGASIFSTILAIKVQFLRADIVDAALYSNESIKAHSFLFVLCILLEICFTYLYLNFEEKHVLQIGLQIKKNILIHKSSYYKEMTSSNKSYIVNTILKQVDLVKEKYYKNIVYLVHLTIKAALIVFTMLDIHIYLTLFIMIMLLNQIFLPKLLSGFLNKLNQDYIETTKVFTEKLDDFLSNFPLIFNFSIVNMVHNKLYQSLKLVNEAEYQKFYGNNLIRHINMLNSYMTHFVTLIICAYLLFKKNINMATFYIIMGLVEQLTMPLIGISFAYQNIIGNKNLVKELKDYKSHQGADLKAKVDMDRFESELRVKNLSFNVDSKRIINDFTYTFQKNKKYLVQGVSGSGKTTLLHILHQSIENHDGEICIDGHLYPVVNVKNIIGIMSDSPAFIQGTIQENIVLGREVDMSDIKHLLTKLSLGSITDRLDEEISFIEEKLSLGERKRIEIMRLLLRDFDILLLDEPTSNLDAGNRKILIDIFSSLNDKTIICTSHETAKDFMEIFDEVIVYGEQNVS